jgi:hypothetical protein
MDIDVDDIDSVLGFLESKYQSKKKTKQRYFVILYGPPASGKTLARKIACYQIKKVFSESKINPNKPYETFIDTSIDDIIYRIKRGQKDQTGKEKLIESLEDFFDRDISEIDQRDIKDNINKIYDKGYKIYSDIRKDYRVDALSELLYFYAVVMEKNIFFELSSPSSGYVNKILKMLQWYDYIPVLIYPYMNDVNRLYELSIARGLTDGRFIKCRNDYNSLINKIIVCLGGYPYLKEVLMKYKSYFIFQYNSGFPKKVYVQLNKNIRLFDDIVSDKYHLELLSQIDGKKKVVRPKNYYSRLYDGLDLQCGG